MAGILQVMLDECSHSVAVRQTPCGAMMPAQMDMRNMNGRTNALTDDFKMSQHFDSPSTDDGQAAELLALPIADNTATVAFAFAGAAAFGFAAGWPFGPT